MTAQQTWTPAPQQGIVPLHPLGFGTILGRSFTVLRHNPRVLLGFAVVSQIVIAIVSLVVIGLVSASAFGRVDTVAPGSEEALDLLAGSALIAGLTGLLVGIAGGAIQVVVQGIVIADVSRAVVAERLTLGRLWAVLRPSIWRLIGWSFLLALVISGLVIALVVAIGALAFVAPGTSILLLILLILGAIPLALWLSTKLILVPSVLVLERASITGAVARSWVLVRGRFWPTLGIILTIQLLFGIVGQIISLPFSLLSGALGGVLAPTGDATATEVVGFVTASLAGSIPAVLIAAVGVIVQTTAAALVYTDARMRAEGLDIDLQRYVEARDAGRTDLADPWLLRIGHAAPERPEWGAQAGYGAGGYGNAGGYAGGYAAGGYANGGYAGTSAPASAAAPEDATPRNDEPSATTWAAPGAADPDAGPRRGDEN